MELSVSILAASLLVTLSHSDEFSPPLLGRIEDYLYQSMMCQKVPGLSVSIVELDSNAQGGVRTFSRGYGTRSPHKPSGYSPPRYSSLPRSRSASNSGSVLEDLTVTERTPFCIGDLTKGFTAALIGQLEERGQLKWDQPINSLLSPSEKLIDSSCSTIQDILSQQTHIPNFRGMEIAGFPVDSRKEFVQRVSLFPALSEKTSKFASFNYNNAMYTLLGYAASRMENGSWEGILQKSLIKPLEMSDTIPLSVIDNLKDSLPQTVVFENKYPHWVPPDFLKTLLPDGPANSLCASANDMTQWITFLLSKTQRTASGRPVMEPETLRKIWTPRTELNIPLGNNTRLSGYGLGWAIGTFHDELLIYHFGSILGFSSAISLLPEKKLGVFVSVSGSVDGTVEVPTLISQGILSEFMDGPEKENSLSVCDSLPTEQQVPSSKCNCKTPEIVWKIAGIYTHPALGNIDIHTKYVSNPYVLGPYPSQYLEINYGRNGIAKICSYSDPNRKEEYWLQYHSPLSLFLPVCPDMASKERNRTVNSLRSILEYPENSIRFHFEENITLATHLSAGFIQESQPPIFKRFHKIVTSTTLPTQGSASCEDTRILLSLVSSLLMVALVALVRSP